ncbi:hypothetical protein HK102_002127 [Quaeritorhiza haematococci]|nr:hypothetical protein HK102_002127 [Quaeritorhiza haematococci]
MLTPSWSSKGLLSGKGLEEEKDEASGRKSEESLSGHIKQHSKQILETVEANPKVFQVEVGGPVAPHSLFSKAHQRYDEKSLMQMHSPNRCTGGKKHACGEVPDIRDDVDTDDSSSWCERRTRDGRRHAAPLKPQTRNRSKHRGGSLLKSNRYGVSGKNWSDTEDDAGDEFQDEGEEQPGENEGEWKIVVRHSRSRYYASTPTAPFAPAHEPIVDHLPRHAHTPSIVPTTDEEDNVNTVSTISTKHRKHLLKKASKKNAKSKKRPSKSILESEETDRPPTPPPPYESVDVPANIQEPTTPASAETRKLEVSPKNRSKGWLLHVLWFPLWMSLVFVGSALRGAWKVVKMPNTIITFFGHYEPVLCFNLVVMLATFIRMTIPDVVNPIVMHGFQTPEYLIPRSNVEAPPPMLNGP